MLYGKRRRDGDEVAAPSRDDDDPADEAAPNPDF
jgi:hypothetical protein